MKKRICFMLMIFSLYTIASADITMTFEEIVGHNGAPISTFYSGVSFTAGASNQEWVAAVGPNYNVSSWPSGTSWNAGNYWIYGNVGAWTEVTGGDGKIAFDNKNATYVELGYCAYSAFWLEAYDENDNLLDSASGPANLRYLNDNPNGPGTLRVDWNGSDYIAYVRVHDSGNYWIIDNVRTDASGITGVDGVIPAPGAILLAGIGTSLVGWLRRKRAL